MNVSNAQNLDSLKSIGLNNQEIIEWLDEKLEREDLDDTAYFNLHASIGDLLSKEESHEKAINHLQKSLVLGNKLKLENELLFIDVLNDLAYNLKILGQFKTVEQYIRTHIGNEIKDRRYVKLCFYYAESLESLGDISLAQQYLERALSISEEIKNEKYTSRSLARLSRLYMQTNSYEKAVVLERNLSNYNYLGREDQLKVVQYNIASIFQFNELYEDAISIFDEIINWAELYEKIEFKLMSSINKASCLRELNQLDEAKAIYKNTMKIDSTNSLTYDNLAQVYYSLGDFDSSIYNIEKALHHENVKINDYNFDKAYVDEILKFPYKEELLTLFHDLAKSYLAKSKIDDDQTCLSRATSLFSLLDNIINEVRFSTSEQQSQHFWRNEVKPIYDDAILMAYLLNDVDQAFYYAEKSKAILLLDDLLKNTTGSKVDIPEKLLDKEFAIKEVIFELELEMSSNKPSEARDSLNNLLLKNKLELTNLIQEMAEVAPSYINAKYVPPLTKLNDLQQEISAKETIINFIWSSNSIFRFIINKESVDLKQIEYDEDFVSQLKTYIKNLKKPVTKKEAFKKQNESSYSIFRMLFRGIDFGTNKLTILPDGILSFLPFEVLVTNQEFESPQYLIENNTINYGFSVNTTFAPYRKTNSKKIVAFAPGEYKSELALAKLSFSDFEFLPIEEVGAKIYTNNEVSKAIILENLTNSKIVHIYSHAEANNKKYAYPWIAGQDELIYLPEIYNHKSNADLVILSACETSLGKEVKGEGVISLARGFFHSGAKSVLASLWKVNDKSNSEIVHHFYQFLKKGNTKAEALRLSKLKYIEDHRIEAQSPYYWAGLVYIGKDGQLSIGGRLKWLKWTLFIFIGILITGIIFRSRKRQ